METHLAARVPLLQSLVTNYQSLFPRVTNHVFVHLHCHSHYSFLRGVASPEEIVAAAAEQKMPAVALTDTNGLYAAVSFYQAAKNAGIKPIVGVSLDVSRLPELVTRHSSLATSFREKRNDPSIQLVLLAADMEGYSNLCQLVTLRHLGTTKLAQNPAAAEIDGRPVTMQELAEHSRGVIALCPLPARSRDVGARRGAACCAPTKTAQADADCLSATSHESPVTSHQSPITNHFSQLKDIFGDRLYIEVQRLSPGDGRVLREAERLGRELGLPLVATNNVHFLRPEEHLHHRVVNAIRTGGLLTTVAPPEITTGEA